MKVKISGILKQNGLKFSWEETESVSVPEIVFQAPIHLKFTFTNTGRTILAEGNAEGGLLLSCSNCLQNFSHPFSFQIVEEFWNSHDAASKTEEGSSLEELSIFFYDESESIDLTEAVRQSILLNLPVHPLCSPNCQGLCPVCGKPKSEGECGCEEELNKSELIDERWGPLKTLSDSFIEKKQRRNYNAKS
jgi:uncharacterized protein